MELKLSTTIWKYALLTLSILISMVTLLFMSCGVVALGCAGSSMGAYIVVAVGCLVYTISFWGCFASLRESYILSMLFLGVTILGIISQTVLMIILGIKKDELMDMTANRVNCLWQKELETPGTMDAIQTQYYCCGKDSPQDYLRDDDDELPSSCCLHKDCSIPTNIYAKGCAIKAINFFDEQSDNLVLTTIGLIALEVLSLVAAYFLAKEVKHIVHKTEQIVISE